MIKSHKNPDKPLWQTDNDNGHLKDVYLGIKNVLLNLKLDEKFLSNEQIDLYSKIIGYCHDIGKATTFFQDKLETEKKEYSKPSDHSKIGAAFSYYITDLLNLQDEIKILIYRLIYCHHSSIHKNLNEIIIGEDNKKNIIKQIEDILNNFESNQILINILKLFNIDNFNKDLFIDIISKINKTITKNSLIFEMNKELTDDKEKNIIIYFLLYSAFSKADKHDALFRKEFIEKMDERKRISLEINNNIVDIHKKILKEIDKEKYRDSKLNNLREEFYIDIKTSIVNLDLNKDKILQVVAPTGIGKTMTIFNAAIMLKNRLLKEQNKIYRIIYSLPFISIIDQTSLVLKDIFKNNNIEVTGDLFLEYHHLSDTTKRNNDEEEINYNIEENVMLNDFWESEIILTTFVAFLEIFSSGSNLLKLSSIINSIIIFDEVQSIDAGLYKYINWFLKMLSNYFNCYIILTTATMPKIFQGGEYKNLYNSKDLENKLYSSLNRYLIKNLGDKSIIDFIEYLKDYLEKNKNESVLVITNTKKMAFQISKELKEKYDNELIHLTTSTIPILRKQFINSINHNKDKRRIIISTQLIEAGIDISVNTIFKFLSPFESIIQAAGRTNRNYELNEIGGKVFIINVLNEKGVPSYKHVYIRDTKKTGGDEKLNNTKNIFKKDEIKEFELLPFSMEYFNSLSLNNYWIDIKKDLIIEKYSDFGNKIQIINDDFDKYSVFIDIELKDEKGKKIKSVDTYNKYLTIKNKVMLKKKDLFKRKNELKKIQFEFSQFCINISEYETKNLPELNKLKENKIIPILNKDSYDYKLGLKIFEDVKNMII